MSGISLLVEGKGCYWLLCAHQNSPPPQIYKNSTKHLCKSTITLNFRFFLSVITKKLEAIIYMHVVFTKNRFHVAANKQQ